MLIVVYDKVEQFLLLWSRLKSGNSLGGGAIGGSHYENTIVYYYIMLQCHIRSHNTGHAGTICDRGGAKNLKRNHETRWTRGVRCRGVHGWNFGCRLATAIDQKVYRTTLINGALADICLYAAEAVERALARIHSALPLYCTGAQRCLAEVLCLSARRERRLVYSTFSCSSSTTRSHLDSVVSFL